VPTPAAGFTYLELMVAVAIAALILSGMAGMLGQALDYRSGVQTRMALLRDADFALQQMTRAVEYSPGLLLPLPDNPDTDWPEQLRQQSFPAATPSGSSSFDSAVLAVILPRQIDRDRDGRPDADNDGDGRFDEDPGADLSNDTAAGLYLIDDDGDGSADTEASDDDDESGSTDEDIANGLDDEDDAAIDEDPPADLNADGCPGLCGVDDDGDGQVDEGQPDDDDEDGLRNEDGIEAVVFHLVDGRLIERMPAPWDANGDGSIDGRDFTESVIAEGITTMRVERLPSSPGAATRIRIRLDLTSTDGDGSVSVQTLLRIGAAL
jgi:type II secretory pathway pseudopilin PulG